MSTKPVVVVGDGWAALGAVGFLVSSGIPVDWVIGTGARILPPLASLEAGPGVSFWSELAARLGVECGEMQNGTLIKEFRNKSFREPAWTRGPTSEARHELQKELLWAPEKSIVGVFDTRFGLSLAELEDQIRKALTLEKFPHLKKVEGIPVSGFKCEDNQVTEVLLGSGDSIVCSQLVYADRWALLMGFEGMPKPVTLMRNRDPMGALQAVFRHSVPLGLGIMDSFFASLPKSPGELVEKHVWGYFTSDGFQSIWTICLSPEEIENNHEIAKKFRRLKGTLDKIFTGGGIVPEGKMFSETVQEEQVRFVEDLIFSPSKSKDNTPVQPVRVKGMEGATFLTDGYGPSQAFYQVGMALKVELGRPDAEAENVEFIYSQA